jgi:hypothetical protein
LGRSGSAVEFLSSGSRDQQRLALVRSRLQRFLQRGEGGAGGEGNHRARRDDVAWPAWDRLHQGGFADSVIADMVGMSIAMVQHYTGLKTSGRPASPCWRCSRRARHRERSGNTEL